MKLWVDSNNGHINKSLHYIFLGSGDAMFSWGLSALRWKRFLHVVIKAIEIKFHLIMVTECNFGHELHV